MYRREVACEDDDVGVRIVLRQVSAVLKVEVGEDLHLHFPASSFAWFSVCFMSFASFGELFGSRPRFILNLRSRLMILASFSTPSFTSG